MLYELVLGTGNSDSHGARPVQQIISVIKWIRTSRLSTQNSLSLHHHGAERILSPPSDRRTQDSV
jgi:hypothetical protein